jgi:hypothetical protein
MDKQTILRILGPVVVAGVFHALLMAAYLGAFRGDPEALVCVGGVYVGHEPYEQLHLGFQTEGYDGQFYYALARAPWRVHERGFDSAPIRHKRILYPALAWALSGGGDPRRLLWVLPSLNLAAIAGLAGLGALLALWRGLSPWWGVLLPLATNAGMPALRDLTDTFSTFLVAGLLVTWLVRGPWWGLALWGALAALCREQNVAVLAALLLVACWRGQWWNCGGLVLALTVWAGWIGVVWSLYGAWPFHDSGQRLFEPPFMGMLAQLRRLPEVSSRVAAATHLFSMGLLLAEVGLAVYLLRQPIDPVLRIVLLLAAAFVLTGGLKLYIELWGVQRVFVLLPLGLWLACVQLRWTRALVPLSLPVLICVGSIVQVWLRGTA